MSWPANLTDPEITGVNRRMERARVLLPHPLSPTSPSVSPAASVRLTPSTARIDKPFGLRLRGNSVTILRTSSSGSALQLGVELAAWCSHVVMRRPRIWSYGFLLLLPQGKINKPGQSGLGILPDGALLRVRTPGSCSNWPILGETIGASRDTGAGSGMFRV